ncbi:hypothetical protein EXIGLDRAFT_338690 [Exidia glandulosa HHB12029]|uniref:Uncharacterized protein n=1 Tax=Exidia glandulosa HHB12029 TaxID=1314781 RepID=A0A165CK37_EXIGL|nr:hypothetical protein EXIGLDRAFT_338690 [Exidia glandulosa HHB12029]
MTNQHSGSNRASDSSRVRGYSRIISVRLALHIKRLERSCLGFQLSPLRLRPFSPFCGSTSFLSLIFSFFFASMTAFARLVVFAALSLALLTNAVPVADTENKKIATTVESTTDSVPAEIGELIFNTTSLVERAVTRPRPRPPVRKPSTPVRKPTKPVRKPTAPVKKPIKRPVPVKRPPVKKPVKKPTPIGAHPAKPSGTHLPAGGTGKNSTVACKMPQKGATKPTKSKPRALFDYYIGHYFEKRAPVFVGWHGTNSHTAEVWHRAGYLASPFTIWDTLSQSRRGRSGASAELGSGIYVTDTREDAVLFSTINAGQNPGTYPALCAIYALSSTAWLGAPKAWLPGQLIGSSSAHEQARVNWFAQMWDHRVFNVQNVFRFAALDHTRGSPPSQFVIPSSMTHQFSASCVNPNGGVIPQGSGNLDYFHLLRPWAIVSC